MYQGRAPRLLLRRVEDGRGGLGHAATLRFPSPLIKPDVRISRIRLSDWFHLAAHGGHRVWCVLPKQWAMADAPSSTDRCPSSPRGKASSEAPGYSGVFHTLIRRLEMRGIDVI